MSNFTPQQIEEFLREFFDTVGARQYIGARYVPIFGRAGEDTVEWDDRAPYEPLTVVMHNGISYVSRRYVPNGIQVTDTDYWAQTYRFNAQVEQYRQQVLALSDVVEDQGEAVDALNAALPIGSFSDTETVRSYIDQTGERVLEELGDESVPWPNGTTYPKYGTTGQVLETHGDGSTEWVDPVQVTSEIAAPLIEEWLDDHPEATTTVEDGAITTAKLADDAVTLAKLAGAMTDLAGVQAVNLQFTEGTGTFRVQSTATPWYLFSQNRWIGSNDPLDTTLTVSQVLGSTAGVIFLTGEPAGLAAAYMNTGTIPKRAVTLWSVQGSTIHWRAPVLPNSDISTALASVPVAQSRAQGMCLMTAGEVSFAFNATGTQASLHMGAGAYLFSENDWIGTNTPLDLSISFTGTKIIVLRKGTTPTLVALPFNTYQFQPGDIVCGTAFQQFNRAVPALVKDRSASHLMTLIREKGTSLKIVLAGDSITAGQGGTGYDPTGQTIITVDGRTWQRNDDGFCWANLLRDYMSDYFGCTVVNNGCSGVTSTFVKDNMTTLIPADTDVCILSVGVNDAGSRATVINTIANNLLAIGRYCIDNDILLFTFTPIPWDSSLDATHDTNPLQKVPAYAFIKTNLGFEWFDLYTEVVNYYFTKGSSTFGEWVDGLHPNDSGYRVLFYLYLKLLGLGAPAELVALPV